MKKEYSMLVTILVSFTVVTAGAIILLTRTPKPSGVRKNLSTLPNKDAGAVKDESSGGVGGLQFELKFVDKYGVESKSKASVKVHEITGTTTYAIAVDDLVMPVNNGEYFAWLQTAEGARTKLGALKVSSDGKGTLEALGVAPQDGWFLLITYIDDSIGNEELILRGMFTQ